MNTKIDRKNFIGASEVASCMGLSPWCTPLKMWCLKTGKIEPVEETENMEWGTRLEGVVAKKFEEKHEVKLMAYKKRFVHPELPYLSCELDRIIVGTDELVEIKTCNAWAAKQWAGDEIPIQYILQVQAQLGLSGRKKGWFAVLVGGSKYLEKEIEFDAELYSQIVAAVIKFWEVHVVGDSAPMACSDDNETLVDLFPESRGEIVEITDAEKQADIDTALEHRLEVMKEITAAENEKGLIDAKIKQVIGANAGISTQKYKCTWANQSRTIADVDALKKDGVFDKYSKTTVSRTFRVTAQKPKEK